MRLGKGWRRNPAGHRAPPARLLLKAPGYTWDEIPTSVDLRKHFPGVMDQGQTSSCTGHGTAAAIFASFAAHGGPLPFVPSPRGIYAVGRAVGRAHEHPSGALPALRDDGAMPADVVAGISLWGVSGIGSRPSDGRYSDCDERNVLEEPRVDELALDGRTLIVGEHLVTARGREARAFEVASLLAQRVAVCFGMFVDGAYEAWRAGMPPIRSTDEGDPAGGGHWQALTGYMRQRDGSVVFNVRGSWGVNAGDHGDFRITDEMLIACDDLTAFRAEMGHL